MDHQAVFVLIPLFFITGGVLVILAAMRQRSETLEMQHRERMAMIERGILPSPGRDPAAFEEWQRRRENPPGRSTSIGIVIAAVGFGLMLLIGVAGGTPDVGVGVGGAIVVLGGAFIVNGAMQRRSRPPMTAPRTDVPMPPPPPVAPPEPPGRVAP